VREHDLERLHQRCRLAHRQIGAAHFLSRIFRRGAFGVRDAPLRPRASRVHQLLVDDQLPIPLVAYEAGAEASPLWEEIWPGPAMKLVGPLAARLPGRRLALAFEIERHCSADEILQGRLIDLVAFMDVDGAPDIPVEAGVE
jgi:hypothetical protein